MSHPLFNMMCDAGVVNDHANDEAMDWAAEEIVRLRQVLRMVASGIWREKSKNACGLVGDAVVVHAVEGALAAEETTNGN